MCDKGNTTEQMLTYLLSENLVKSPRELTLNKVVQSESNFSKCIRVGARERGAHSRDESWWQEMHSVLRELSYFQTAKCTFRGVQVMGLDSMAGTRWWRVMGASITCSHEPVNKAWCREQLRPWALASNWPRS